MKSGLPSQDQTSSAPSLMVESYPNFEHFSNLRSQNVEDHFKVTLET